MIRKSKHMFFAKEVTKQYVNMNAHVYMDVDDDSHEAAKTFQEWVQNLNGKSETKMECCDYGMKLDYEIEDEFNHPQARFMFDLYHLENHFDESERKEFEKFMNDTAKKIDKMVNKKD